MSKDLTLAFLADGKSVHTERWLKYFADHGYNVHLITFDARPISGVKVQETKYYLKFAYPLRIFFIKRMINKIKPDILHAHYVSTYGAYAALTGFRPFIVTVWGSDILVASKRGLLPLMKAYVVRYVLKKADVITCDAEHVKRTISTLGINTQKVIIVNFGVDVNKFSPKEKSEKLMSRLGVLGSPTVISLRNLEPIYDVESLIRAVPLVLKEIPKAKFLIAGKGSEEERLIKLAKSLGVSRNVKFMGFIHNEELPVYLNAADVYVSTALSDAGIAASTAEAMACGLPVIVTDVADNRKWVEDGVNGFIVPIRNPKILSERIIYLLRNKDLRKRFGEINRKIIEDRNNYYKEMGKMEEIYKLLVRRLNK